MNYLSAHFKPSFSTPLLFKGDSKLFLLTQGSTSLQFPAECVPGELIPPWELCQHCAFSSRPLLPLRCLPCCIYSFLVRLNKPRDSCIFFSHGFGSGGKPLVRCFPQEGAGASLWLCFTPFRRFWHLSQFVSPLLVQAWDGVALPLLMIHPRTQLGWDGSSSLLAMRWGLASIWGADTKPASGISPGMSGVARWDV